MRDSLLVLMLILGQSTCSGQPQITVLMVDEHTCVNLPCDCGIRGSPWVRWMRDADMDGVVEQQISCNRSDCYDIDCDQKQNTKLNHHHKILPNGDLQISRVEKRDSGLYRCLNEPSRGSLTDCDSTSSFCTSGDQEEESAGAVTQSSCEAALLLYISAESADSPQESKDYKIHIKTGGVWRAGTGANVYITMCGGLECVTHHLKESTHPVLFKQNQVDIFTVQSLYLGNLESVTIWHDGSGRLFSWSGFLSTWFLENIRIIETLSGVEQTFTCSCWVAGNDPKTLYPQIPKSCDSSEEREPKKPHVPEPLMETPLLSCEIQNPPSNKFSLLWMFRSTEGHNRVIAVAGTRTDILASCLGKSKQRNHGVLEPGQDSCPESSHCLRPPSGVTRDELERYRCLIGPGEDGTWREQVLSVLSSTPDDRVVIRNQIQSTTGEETNNPSSFSGCRPALIAAITLNVLALFPFTMFVFFVKRYREKRF